MAPAIQFQVARDRNRKLAQFHQNVFCATLLSIWREIPVFDHVHLYQYVYVMHFPFYY